MSYESSQTVSHRHPPLSVKVALAISVLAYLTVPDAVKADLLVASVSTNSILRFSGTGALVGTFVASGSGGIIAMVDPIFGPDGNLYIPDAAGNTVGRYNGSTGAFIDSFVSAGSGGLTRSYSIAFGPDGNLYVADYGIGVIRRYSGTTGAYMGTFTDGGTPAITNEWQHVHGPSDIIFGPDGNLYVADEATVVKFNGTTGAYIGVFISGGGPSDLAFGSDGNLYVATTSNGVLRYNGATGAFISNFVPFNGSRADGGLAFGPDGNLYIGNFNEFQLTDYVTNYNGVTGALIGVFVPPGIIGKVDGLVFTPGSTVPVGVRPAEGGNTGLVTVQISGTGLQSGSTVKLTGLGAEISGTNTNIPYPSALATTFDLTGATPGVRNVVITNPDNTTITLVGGFTVEQGGAPQISVNIIGRNQIRIGTPQTYYAEVSNQGTIDAPVVVATYGAVGGQVSSSASLAAPLITASQSLAIPTNLIPFYVGPLHANSTVSTSLSILAPSLPACFPLQNFGHIVQGGDPCTFLKAASEAGDKYLNLLYSLRLEKLTSWAKAITPVAQGGFGICFNLSDLSTKLSCLAYKAADDILGLLIQGAEDAKNKICGLQLLIGCTCEGPLPSSLTDLAGIANGLHDAEEQLEPLFNMATIPSAEVQAVESQVALLETQAVALPGSPLFAPQTEPLDVIPVDSSSTLQVCNVSSLDPNDKSGPQGTGTSRFIAGKSATPYSVFFDNQPAATASAQAVTITDPLDASLDLATVTLGPVTFPNQVVTPPSIPLSAAPFSATLDLRPATNLMVSINASLNTANRTVTWTFHSLDPTTGQSPTDPAAGFLPPGAEGSVFFTAMPKANLPTGTLIQNTATVVFDANPPINTPTWSNTIDNTAPVSGVSALPTPETMSSFLVQWSGSDLGAGVQDYTVYVSDNGGTYTAWLTNTPATQATYTGANGHAYAFYSIARDLVGNIEASKTSAEGTTLVKAPLTITTTSLTGGVAGAGYSQTLTATGGTAPYSWSVAAGRLPAGLTLSASTGLISGTAVNPGSSSVTFKVTDTSVPGQSATVTLVLAIAPGTLTITTTSLPSGQVGVPYSQTLQAIGGTAPLTWWLEPGTALSAGLTLNSATGEISGTPVIPVSIYRFLARVTDSTGTVAQTATASFVLTISN